MFFHLSGPQSISFTNLGPGLAKAAFVLALNKVILLSRCLRPGRCQKPTWNRRRPVWGWFWLRSKLAWNECRISRLVAVVWIAVVSMAIVWIAVIRMTAVISLGGWVGPGSWVGIWTPVVLPRSLVSIFLLGKNKKTILKTHLLNRENWLVQRANF